MVLGVMLLVAGVQGEMPSPPPSVDMIVARTRRLTSVETHCVYDPNSTDISVCGRRNADRFRVPFESTYEPGDPRHEGVMDERTRLMARSTPLRDLSPFQVGGGHVGVTVETGGRRGAPTLRKPAP